jgi:hypothetical protein
MSIVMRLLVEESFGPDTLERRYSLTGSTVDADIQAHVLANTATTVGSLTRDKPVITSVAPGIYEARVRYGPASGSITVPPPTGAFYISGATTGDDVTLTQALDHIGTWGNAGAVSTPYMGAINVNDDGEPEGVSVPTGRLTWTETGYLPIATVNLAFLRNLALNTGTVNSDSTRGFAPGELRYDGTRFTKRDAEGDYELVSEFSVSPNQTGITIGDVSVPGTKEGWDYLWVSYRKEPDASGQYVKVVPDLVHIERVYRRINFSSLGLPTS